MKFSWSLIKKGDCFFPMNIPLIYVLLLYNHVVCQSSKGSNLKIWKIDFLRFYKDRCLNPDFSVHISFIYEHLFFKFCMSVCKYFFNEDVFVLWYMSYFLCYNLICRLKYCVKCLYLCFSEFILRFILYSF